MKSRVLTVVATALVSVGLAVALIAWLGTGDPVIGNDEPRTVQPLPSSVADSDDPLTGELRLEVVARLSHDTTAWIQGLLVQDGRLFESTGAQLLPTTVRELDRATGEILRVDERVDELYGEGLELVDGELWLLTWQDETLIVYDAATLDETRRLDYEGEGWGLCRDDDRLVRSDGSSSLHFHDPATFEQIGTLDVSNPASLPTGRLNELECVDGFAWANDWTTDTIARIDLDTGEVVATLDVSNLSRPSSSGAIANGIAYDESTDTWLLTGKLWDTIYEVRILPPA